jgi:hypothetical protein
MVGTQLLKQNCFPQTRWMVVAVDGIIKEDDIRKNWKLSHSWCQSPFFGLDPCEYLQLRNGAPCHVHSGPPICSGKGKMKEER